MNVSKEYIGVLVMRTENKLTVNNGDNKSIIILISKSKSFDLEVTKRYKFMCGVSEDKKLWLNEVVEVKQEIDDTIVVPKDSEGYKQFQIDKRAVYDKLGNCNEEVDEVLFNKHLKLLTKYNGRK